MSVQKNISIAIVGFVSLLAASFLLLTISVSAHEGDEQVEQTAQVTSVESTDAQEEAFNYVAQRGDSYSLMARKAVQTYGIETSTNLSGAQIIFVETNLTQAAKSPVLNLGEKVSISRQLVSEWSEKAKSLTDKQQAAWQVYANNANFSTDSVGEAR